MDVAVPVNGHTEHEAVDRGNAPLRSPLDVEGPDLAALGPEDEAASWVPRHALGVIDVVAENLHTSHAYAVPSTSPGLDGIG